ncbi:PIG-L family deacetylase [Kribbella albertanoniae]|uniref:PIG-L family deacetylase n=1 Tax=Kribbella albertanoniae TaxID=1266829 RepID=A0A4R4QH44_9ACTN|nr:PIG-L family deacetylase [Kribbella albertanoniae]TDC35041.1 PIG-L family deacetylase [Kribbella albertanoniae]
MSWTLVVFQAHPDDEIVLTAGTMARAADQGHRVVLVVATDGGLGRTRLELGPYGDLGRLRWSELTKSAGLLGVHRLVGLGYADSGAGPVVPADPADRCRFVRAPLDEAAGRLAEILRQECADVLIIDDPGGGYGHRDHVRAHQVGARAADLAGTTCVLQATIPVVYSSARLVTHRIDVRRYVAVKRSALAAHVSQSSRAVGGDRMLVRCLALPPLVFGWLFGSEWFIGRKR